MITQPFVVLTQNPKGCCSSLVLHCGMMSLIKQCSEVSRRRDEIK